MGWIDRRNDRDDNLFIQFITEDGRTRWEPEGKPLSTALRSQTGLQLVSGGDSVFYAVWTDTRAIDLSGFDLYMQKVDLRGRSHWALNGIPLCREKGYQTSVDLAQDGKGGFYASWMDERSEFYNIYLQHVLPDGSFQFLTGGQALNLGRWHQRTPELCLDKQGRIVAVWADDQEGTMSTQIRGQSLDFTALRKWTTGGEVLVPNQARQSEPRVQPLPDNSLFISWLDERAKSSEGYQLFASRISPDGANLWPGSGVAIGNQMNLNNPYSFKIYGNRAVFAWDQFVGTDTAKKIFWGWVDLPTGHLQRKVLLNNRPTHQCQPYLIPLGEKPAILWIERRLHQPDQLMLRPVGMP